MGTRAALFLIVLAVGVFAVTGCKSYVIAEYDQGERLQAGESYEEAIAKYEEFISKYPDSVLVPNAMFSIASCYRGMNDSQKATAAYDKLIKQFPEDEVAEWARVEKARLQEAK